MNKNNISKLTKAEKIQLIKDLANKKVSVVNGHIVSSSVILFKKSGKYYLDPECKEEAPDINEAGFDTIVSILAIPY